MRLKESEIQEHIKAGSGGRFLGERTGRGRLMYVNTRILSCVTDRLGQLCACVCANKCETDVIGVTAETQHRSGRADPETNSHLCTRVLLRSGACAGESRRGSGDSVGWGNSPGSVWVVMFRSP